MDGSRFDTIARTFATIPITRATVLRDLAASAVALAGVRLATPSGAAKKNRKDEKAQKVCVCGADGTVASCRTQKKAKDKVKKLLKRTPCASKGKCTGVNPCATCTPSCEQKICGDNGCGGSCGTCEADQACANGRCVSICPGQKVCAGNCIPNDQCCLDSDCAPNEACHDGRCKCAPEFGSCGAQRFCNRDTLRCEACRGTGGSCFAGTNVISTDACCAGVCLGSACP